MNKAGWVIVAVIVTILIFAGSIAWSVFVGLLMIGLRIAPWVLVILLLVWLYNRKKEKDEKK